MVRKIKFKIGQVFLFKLLQIRVFIINQLKSNFQSQSPAQISMSHDKQKQTEEILANMSNQASVIADGPLIGQVPSINATSEFILPQKESITVNLSNQAPNLQSMDAKSSNMPSKLENLTLPVIRSSQIGQSKSLEPDQFKRQKIKAEARVAMQNQRSYLDNSKLDRDRHYYKYEANERKKSKEKKSAAKMKAEQQLEAEMQKKLYNRETNGRLVCISRLFKPGVDISLKNTLMKLFKDNKVPTNQLGVVLKSLIDQFLPVVVPIDQPMTNYDLFKWLEGLSIDQAFGQLWHALRDNSVMVDEEFIDSARNFLDTIYAADQDKEMEKFLGELISTDLAVLINLVVITQFELPNKLLYFLLETYGDLILQDLDWKVFVKFVQLNEDKRVLILQHCFPITKQVAILISGNLRWLLREEFMHRFSQMWNVTELDFIYLSRITDLEERTQLTDLLFFTRNKKFASFCLKSYGLNESISFPDLMEISKGLDKTSKATQEKLMKSKPESIVEIKKLVMAEKDKNEYGLAAITDEKQYQILDTIIQQAKEQLNTTLQHQELLEQTALQKACRELARLTKLTPLEHQIVTAGLALYITTIDAKVSIFDIPTGCGKTLILLILAQALDYLGQKVLYLTPNDYLKIVAYKLVESNKSHSAQPESQSNILHLTFQEYLNSFNLTDFAVVLIDEFDEFLHADSALINQESITGGKTKFKVVNKLAQLMRHQSIIGFTGTVLEQTLTKVKQSVVPKVFKVSPKSKGMENKFIGHLSVCYKEGSEVESCKRKMEKVNELFDQGNSVLLIDEYLAKNKTNYINWATKHYRCHPVILDDWKGASSFNVISRTLARIKEHSGPMIVITDAYGARGIDFQFAVKAVAVIDLRAKTLEPYLQALGRVSRGCNTPGHGIIVVDEEERYASIKEVTDGLEGNVHTSFNDLLLKIKLAQHYHNKELTQSNKNFEFFQLGINSTLPFYYMAMDMQPEGYTNWKKFYTIFKNSLKPHTTPRDLLTAEK